MPPAGKKIEIPVHKATKRVDGEAELEEARERAKLHVVPVGEGPDVCNRSFRGNHRRRVTLMLLGRVLATVVALPPAGRASASALRGRPIHMSAREVINEARAPSRARRAQSNARHTRRPPAARERR